MARLKQNPFDVSAYVGEEARAEFQSQTKFSVHQRTEGVFRALLLTEVCLRKCLTRITVDARVKVWSLSDYQIGASWRWVFNSPTFMKSSQCKDKRADIWLSVPLLVCRDLVNVFGWLLSCPRPHKRIGLKNKHQKPKKKKKNTWQQTWQQINFSSIFFLIWP